MQINLSVIHKYDNHAV